MYIYIYKYTHVTNCSQQYVTWLMWEPQYREPSPQIFRRVNCGDHITIVYMDTLVPIKIGKKVRVSA